jgi:GT2 family glycosyltransferase
MDFRLQIFDFRFEASMQLSIIIVNYNVRHFLEQCLYSVQKALAGMEAEVLVVDNASTDGSREYLTPKFPGIQFLWCKENPGFAKANNLALKQAKGKFVLFLNPDTIVAEDCFLKCIDFMHTHTDAGALGVRMIDGSGQFLPESKRAFPSSGAAFFKLSGLAAIFPSSKLFARYNLGYLSEHETHVVDVLSGAFMMVRKDVLAQTGGFDESFFMYAEDIDLSYRIQQSINPATKELYKNYYFSSTTIIHYKGESTQKGSLNYVRLFYKAMLQFVKKHPQKFYNGFFNLLIQMAIAGRAFISWMSSFFPTTAPKNKAVAAFLIVGQKEETEKVVKKFPSLQAVEVADSINTTNTSLQNVKAILLCQGNRFSFHQIIAITEQWGGTHNIYIHANNSSSAVNSNSKNSSGISIEAVAE